MAEVSCSAGVFRSPCEAFPVDLFEHGRAFYERRKARIDRRVDALERLSGRALAEELAAAWSLHMAALCTTAKARYVSRDLTKDIACIICAGLGPALAPILRLLLSDMSGWSCGLPDLILFGLKRLVNTSGGLSTADPRLGAGVSFEDLPLTPEKKENEGDLQGADDGDDGADDEGVGSMQDGADEAGAGETAVVHTAVATPMVYDPNEEYVVKLVEVKSERDQLSTAQKAWIAKFMDSRICSTGQPLFELCKVLDG
jgi:hypothetical protein